MQLLNGRYSQAFNVQWNRKGHLFEDRYKAIVVEKESYLLELCRYVVLNPVRARMVRSAREWRWSKYRATSGEAGTPGFLDVGGGGARSADERNVTDLEKPSGINSRSVTRDDGRPHQHLDSSALL